MDFLVIGSALFWVASIVCAVLGFKMIKKSKEGNDLVSANGIKLRDAASFEDLYENYKNDLAGLYGAVLREHKGEVFQDYRGCQAQCSCSYVGSFHYSLAKEEMYVSATNDLGTHREEATELLNDFLREKGVLPRKEEIETSTVETKDEALIKVESDTVIEDAKETVETEETADEQIEEFNPWATVTVIVEEKIEAQEVVTEESDVADSVSSE